MSIILQNRIRNLEKVLYHLASSNRSSNDSSSSSSSSSSSKPVDGVGW